MAHGKTDNEMINKTHNTARFFVEVRQISWVLLIGVLLWGTSSYFGMPQRKDPEIAVRQAVAITPWPGASADKVEQLVTKKIEDQMAANALVTKIESISRTSVSVVYLELDEKSSQSDRGKQLDDVAFRLNSISDLPSGAGPINFIRDFGDTAALMLTVASPKAGDADIALRARTVQQAIENVRAQAPAAQSPRFTIIVNFPQSLGARIVHPALEAFSDFCREKNFAADIRLVQGADFIGLDAVSSDDDATLLGHLQQFVAERMQSSGLHPDTWQPAVIRDPKDTRDRIAEVAGDRYTYRQLDEFTDLIAKTLKTLPEVSKVERKGLLDEKVYLVYSQERLASYGITLSKLPDILRARNITVAGGQIDVRGRNLTLVASRLASMTFLPLLGYYMIKPKKEPTIEERRKKGFAAFYYRVGTAAINHRWKVLAGSVAFLALGAFFMSQLKTQFFPKDLSYLSYVDVWLPEDAPLEATNKAAVHTEAVIRDAIREYAEHHPVKDGKPPEILRSLTTFVGGGGPRFWFSVSPEQQQLNYAQIIVEVNDKHETEHLIGPLQEALSAQVPEARIDVRQLESGKTVGLPISIRISGDDAAALRADAEEVMDIFRSIPQAERPRDDWGDESFAVKLQTDPDRANITGITNLDVAAASATALSGYSVTSLREGDKEIPVVAQLRMQERARLADLNNLYVYSSSGTQRVPLRQVSSVSYQMQTEKLRRRNQFRTITVSCSPVDGVLASEVMAAARPKLAEFARSLPPGYKMEIGGEEESQIDGFHDLVIVLGISVVAIFLTLVFQFRSAIKPVIVFAAVPYGAVGALAALWIMGSPFGFMAFLGIVSLVGVIVSHIIVLFDFIEEKHAEGEPLREALLDAGIIRLRPVLITVGATVIALFPLAMHGGPLWEPMCYAQIGGLTAATFITLLLVPVIYSIFVLDLKLIKWEKPEEEKIVEESGEPRMVGATG